MDQTQKMEVSSLRPELRAHGDTWLSLGSYEDVLNSDFDYWGVRKELLQSGMEMIRILRIHNKNLRDRFDQEVEHFKKTKPPGFDEHIEFLYHGTKAPIDKICAEGLDERESPLGHFGRGIYFSDNPEMCRAYCEDNASATSEHFIVRCRVILGEPKVYAPDVYDPELTREPVKSNVGGKLVYYDSVQGQVGPYKQYVVYERRRVNIQYIVYYKSSQPLPVLLDVPKRAASASSRQHVTAQPRTTSPPGSHQRRPSSGDDRPASDDDRPASDDDNDNWPVRRSSECSTDDDVRRRRRSSSVSSQGSDSGLDEARSAPVAPSSGGVQKVTATRDRTRRLLKTSGSSQSSDTAGTNSGAAVRQIQGAEAVRQTQTAVDTSAAYRQAEQERAIQSLFDLKGKVPDSKIDELLTSYTKTYGHPGQQLTDVSRIAPPQHSAAISDIATAASSTAGSTSVSSRQDVADADVEDVMTNLIAEFEQCLPGVDRRVARRYIEMYQMNIETAIGAYLDDNMN